MYYLGRSIDQFMGLKGYFHTGGIRHPDMHAGPVSDIQLVRFHMY